jgi:hypothetical protein
MELRKRFARGLLVSHHVRARVGIHRIHFYRIAHRLLHPKEAPASANVHRYYAQRREDRGFSPPWLVR